jgi:hypothetical protein
MPRPEWLVNTIASMGGAAGASDSTIATPASAPIRAERRRRARLESSTRKIFSKARNGSSSRLEVSSRLSQNKIGEQPDLM